MGGKLRALTVALCVCAVAFAPAGAWATPGAQPLPPAKSLGDPPVPCFGYGSSDNICPDEGFDNPDPPEYMAATYYGTLEIQNHILHAGQDVDMYANEDYKGEPFWSTGGLVVSGCKDRVESEGMVVTPAETTCIWKAEAGGPFPPPEGGSGWRGGWEVFEISFCGFFGCAPSGDYYYVIENQDAISGYVRDSSGKPASGVTVAIQGASGGVSAQVDPETGFYNAVVPDGSYSVSVEREGAEAYAFGAGKVTSCSGSAEEHFCNLTLKEETGVASFQLPLEVSYVEKNQGPIEGGQSIQIHGAGFTEASAVEFTPQGGGTPIPAKSFTVDSDSEITAVTPNASSALAKGKHALITDVRVSQNGQTSPVSSGDRYTFGATHTLTIEVTEGAGKPAGGIKFKMSGEGGEVAEASTNAEGQIAQELGEGKYSVGSVPLGAALPEAASANAAKPRADLRHRRHHRPVGQDRSAGASQQQRPGRLLLQKRQLHGRRHLEHGKRRSGTVCAGNLRNR
jgi:Carboxypeptidase regulatory-like domain/IPT/TIG domain